MRRRSRPRRSSSRSCPSPTRDSSPSSSLPRRDDDAGLSAMPMRYSPSWPSRRARERASAGGDGVAVGTHPLARGEEPAIVALPRYEQLRAELGERLHAARLRPPRPRRDARCGDSAPRVRGRHAVASRTAGALGQLAYAEGEATGLRSTRAERLLLMPTGGTPPLLPDWSAWEEATAETKRGGTGTRGRGRSTGRSRCA